MSATSTRTTCCSKRACRPTARYEVAEGYTIGLKGAAESIAKSGLPLTDELVAQIKDAIDVLHEVVEVDAGSNDDDEGDYIETEDEDPADDDDDQDDGLIELDDDELDDLKSLITDSARASMSAITGR